MTAIADLLVQGADALRRFQRTGDVVPYESGWLDGLAQRMTVASKLGADQAEREVRSIAHSLSDSGPSENEAAPSFWLALDALQRKAKSGR